jgi:pimeloyl-ACP methyl ester carboxylesterase
MGGSVTVRGVRLHFVDLGPRDCPLPPAVLLHGNGATAHDFIDSGVAKMLARERRVIVFDRPGAGYSERPRRDIWTVRRQAEFIREALRLIGVSQPIVVGHSFGTLVALSLATQMRGGLSGLVLLSGYYYPTFRPDALLFGLPAIPVIGDVYRYTIAPLLGWLMAPALIRKVFAPSPVPHSFQAFPVSLSLRPSQLRATAADSVAMLEGAAALRRQYAEIRMPVAIVGGTADQIVEIDQSKRLHKEIPGSALHLVAGVGHMLHHLNPLLVAAAIDAIERRGAIDVKPTSIAQASEIHDAEATYDKTLADSFPASDPPANSGITKQ